MRLITLDMETHYSSEYSLSRMSPLEYVRDPRFQLISCAIKVDDYNTDVFFGREKVEHAFGKLQPIIKDALVIAHNMSGFDAYVCAYALGLRPKMWGCTLAMARPVHAKTVGLGLAALVKHYQNELEALGVAGAKDNSVLVQTRGKRLEDFTPAELEAMRTYNRNDTDQCWGLFKLLRKHYTPAELWQIDALIRMRTEPQFELDVPLLETAASVERTRKHKALLDLAGSLRKAAVTADGAVEALDWSDEDAVAESVRADLASAPKFSALLESLGVEVPMKPSPTNPARQVPALSKTDEAFTDLQEHENPLVAAAARARLGVKSTLLETRIEKFLTAGRLAGGFLPVPLRYCGADTTGRDSGEEYNCMTAGHELLTPNGWVDIKNWEPNTPVMQWDSTGRLSWCFAPGKVHYEHDGPVVVLNGPFARGVYTPDHRIPLFRGRYFAETTAGRVAAGSGLDGIPAAGRYTGPEIGGPTCAQVRFLVALAADGCVAKTGQIRFGFRRQRKIDRIQDILQALGLDAVARVYDYRGKPGGHWVAVLPKSAVAPWMSKGFGPWIMALSRIALDTLVNELPHWDGMPHSKTGNTCFFTSDYEQASWVSTALHLSGKPARIGARSNGRFDVYARSTDKTSATGEIDHFTGTVYCPQVETGFVLVRYDGAIHVTGNCQNLPRIDPDRNKTSDALRSSLRAPRGKKIIVADQSGIELRVNHFLWKVPSSMELYEASPAKADLYRAFAAESLFKVPPEQISKSQRQLGKVAQLGLGFGAGGPAFQRVARTMGGIRLHLNREEYDGPELTAEEVVASWRESYNPIVQGWRACAKGVLHIADGLEAAVDPWGLVRTSREGFVLPSGRLIRYPELREEDDGHWPDGRPRRSWFYGVGRHKARITGPKADENIVQALARDSIFDCAIEFFRRTGLRPALRVHDELVYVVDEGPAEGLLAELQATLRTPPKWWPQLIVWSEGDVADTYGAAK